MNLRGNRTASPAFLAIAAAIVLGAVALAPAEESVDALVERSLASFHRAEAAQTEWDEHYDVGIDLAERAIEKNPRHAEAHYALFLNLGRRAERGGLGAQIFTVRRLESLLERTLELDPRHAHAWRALGEMKLAIPGLLGGSRSEGETALRKAAELDPRWAKPWISLAELYRDEGELERARDAAERARRLACDEATPPAADSCRAAKRLIASIERP